MASCQTWTSSTHIRHPWFDAAVMKRKHRDVDPDTDADASSSSSSVSSSNSHPASSAGANGAPPNSPRTPARGTHPAKRRRCSSTLEHGLAHLSLGNGAGAAPPAAFARDAHPPSHLHTTTGPHANATTHAAYPRVEEVPLPAPLPMVVTRSGEGISRGLESAPGSGCTSPMAVDLEMFASPPPPPPQQQQHMYVVEEAETEELEGRAPEVKMGVVSWYEPEPDRIVITDLESFTQEAEEEEEEAARVQLSINEALLARIRRQRAAGETSLTSSSTSAATSTNQALVLFKPLPLSDTELEKVNNAQAKQRERAVAEAERTRKARGVELEQRGSMARDEDAMDIEP
ncbi:hypothetical protein BJ912DRAFT_50292 [Pholiota molesta]|nr:hypothetical protein BJ912DRAFT_50292 [Pholiota molesta]